MEKKKIKKIIFPALAVSIFIPLVTMAASDDSALSAKKFFGERKAGLEMRGERANFANLSDEEKATIKAEMDAKNIEREARREEMMNMTEEEREAVRAEREAERTAIQSAITAGDYDAWLTLAKDNNCPFLNEVTRENFVEFFANRPEINKGGMRKGGMPRGSHMGNRASVNLSENLAE